jgi:ABC-type sugar transport system permease subunit
MKRNVPLLFLLPSVLVMLGIAVYPVGFGLWASFHQWNWAIGQADDLMPDGTRRPYPSPIPFGVMKAGQVNVTRRIYFNKEESYVRYVDVLRNTQPQEQKIAFQIQTNSNYGVNAAQMIAVLGSDGQALYVNDLTLEYTGLSGEVMMLDVPCHVELTSTIGPGSSNRRISSSG